MRIVLLLVLLLFSCALAHPAAAQSPVATAQRLQRMVAATHVGELRAVASPVSLASPTHDLSLSLRAFEADGRAMLRQQLRIPLHSRADLTLGGRLGVFGLSSTARVRLRF